MRRLPRCNHGHGFEWHLGKLLLHGEQAMLGKVAWRLERRLGRALRWDEEQKLALTRRPDEVRTRWNMLKDGTYRLVARDGGLVYEARP